MPRQLTCILRRIVRAALSIAVLLALLTADMHAGDRTADNSPVQCIYVPADEPGDWPRDKSQHYLPMSADDFEKSLDQIRNGNRANPLAIPQLASADYTAALSGDCLVRGEAKLRFDWEVPSHTWHSWATANCLCPNRDGLKENRPQLSATTRKDV